MRRFFIFSARAEKFFCYGAPGRGRGDGAIRKVKSRNGAGKGIKKLDDSGDLDRTVKSNVSRGERGEVIYEYE